MTRLAWLPLLALAAASSGARAPHPADQGHDVTLLLRQVAGFTPHDAAAVQRGQPIARVLDTERAEVAVCGAVHIRAPRERILDHYRDVSLLAKHEMVLQVGRFSAAPRADDLRDLVFEPYDLDSLRECEPGDCAVRVPATSMPRFRQDVDWRGADWRTRAAAVWRQVLAGYAAEYRANGDRALAEYHNKEAPLRLQDQFALLYRASSFVTPLAPEVLQYLQEYPRVARAGAEDILYWSKDDFGPRPVLSVTHLSIHAPPQGATAQAAVASTKQIYATHYFDAALGITLAFDDGSGGSFMVVINRARTRSLTSPFRGFVRGIVQGRAREGVEKMLRSTKQSLERPR